MGRISLVFLVGTAFVALAMARAVEEEDTLQAQDASRKTVKDTDSNIEINPKQLEADEENNQRRHHHHKRRHQHRRHHHPRHEDSADEDRNADFYGFSYHEINKLAKGAQLASDDRKKLMKIFEENKPQLKYEDRSEWTEEQWQDDKDIIEKRRKLVTKTAFDQIEDQEHLTIFFTKLEERYLQVKKTYHDMKVAYLRKIAKKSGLEDSEFDRFLAVYESHKSNVHWRVGMHQNEKTKAYKNIMNKWQLVKEEAIEGLESAEKENLEKFFAAVEEDIANRPRYRHARRQSVHGEHGGHESDEKHHELRCHRRHHQDSDEDSQDRSPHHRHHRHNFEADKHVDYNGLLTPEINEIAKDSKLEDDDRVKLMNIIEQNRPEYKREDRSEWTEEQWQDDNDKMEKRRENVKKTAFDEIEDQEHLTIFFAKLESKGQQILEKYHNITVAYLRRIANTSGLDDLEFARFMIVYDSHKAKVHWRTGMHKNEKANALKKVKENWGVIKTESVKGLDDSEKEKLQKFFKDVEEDFASRPRYHHIRPKEEDYPERYGRHNSRRHHNHRNHHEDDDNKLDDGNSQHHRGHHHSRGEDDDEDSNERRSTYRHHRPNFEADKHEDYYGLLSPEISEIANDSKLCDEDHITLMKIIEKNKPEFKREDRSEWTEEQWQEDKDKMEKRRETVKKEAFDQIEDQDHLTVFFEKLEEKHQQILEKFHNMTQDYLKKIANTSGLDDSEFGRFMIVCSSHKPNVHWRMGMHKNEKAKAMKQLKANWEVIKKEAVKDLDDCEKEKLQKFFQDVEEDVASRHHTRPKQDDYPERYGRHNRRYHNDQNDDEEFDDRKAQHHHRHHHNRGQDEDEDNDEVTSRRHHHGGHGKHHGHKRHHHDDDDVDSEEGDRSHRTSTSQNRRHSNEDT